MSNFIVIFQGNTNHDCVHSFIEALYCNNLEGLKAIAKTYVNVDRGVNSISFEVLSMSLKPIGRGGYIDYSDYSDDERYYYIPNIPTAQIIKGVNHD